MDFAELDRGIAIIEAAVREFEPGLLDARGAVRAVERFARITHLGEAGTALAAKRADDTHAYRDSGARSAGHWLAKKTGVPVAAAFRALETAADLVELPATNDAFRAGRLSEEQAHEIAGAARKDPSAEARGEPRVFATNEPARPRGGLAASQPPHSAAGRVGRGTRGGPALPVNQPVAFVLAPPLIEDQQGVED